MLLWTHAPISIIIKNSPSRIDKEFAEPISGKRRAITRLPNDIRPELRLCRVRVLTWGLRDLAKVHYLSVSEPHIQFECGGVQAVRRQKKKK